MIAYDSERKPGPLYHLGFFLAGTYDLSPGKVLSHLSIQGQPAEKIFDALDWLAAMNSHIPDQKEQMVRYYVFFSNISRGFRQKENWDDAAYAHYFLSKY